MTGIVNHGHVFTKKWDFERRPLAGREPCLTFDEVTDALGIKQGQVRSLITVHRIQPVFRQRPYKYHLSAFKAALDIGAGVAHSPRRKELLELLGGMAVGGSALVKTGDLNMLQCIRRDTGYKFKTKAEDNARRLWLLEKPALN